MQQERFTPATASWLESGPSRRAVWAALMPRRGGELMRAVFGLAASLVDLGTIVGTGVLVEVAYQLMTFGRPVSLGLNVQAAALVGLVVVVASAARETYRVENYRRFDVHPRQLVPLWTAATVLVLALGFVTKTTADYSRALALASFVAGLPALLAARYAMVWLARRPALAGALSERRVHLVGFEEDIEAFHRNRTPERNGLRVVGTSLLRRGRPGGEPAQHAAQLEEDLSLAVSVVRFLRPDDVFVLVPWTSSEDVERCVNAFLSVPAALHLRPERVLNRFAELQIGPGAGLLGINVGRRPLTPLEVAVKRAFDLAVGGVALILLMPVLAAIAVLIRLDSRGPVLFIQHRYGFNQQPFRVLKFRSMKVNDGVFRQVTRDDDRVTRVGRYLRRWNLDELPQLWNVIRGEMSLVGPRPHALAHDRSFERRIALYARRHNVKPGITGWAQVNGYRGETSTDESMRGRVEHDLHYIDNWSPFLDLRILVATVLSRRAYRNAF